MNPPIVRRRPDGVTEIVPRCRLRVSRDPYVGSVLMALVSCGLFVTTLVTLPVLLLIMAPCLLVELWRARRVRQLLQFPPAPVEELPRRRWSA